MKIPTAQGEIDFSTRARHSDPSTSHQAGKAAERFAFDHHARIVGSLITQGPGTIWEISHRTGLDHVAVARRMSELLDLRLVHRTGETRAGATKRSCHVWEAA